MITDERWGEILGVHIIGAEASSLIEEAVMAMRCEATAQAAGSTIHAHPTLSETLMEAFWAQAAGDPFLEQAGRRYGNERAENLFA